MARQHSPPLAKKGSLYGTTVFIAVGVGAARMAGLILVATLARTSGQEAVALFGLATLAGSVAGLAVSMGLPTYLTHAYARGDVSLEEAGVLHRARAGGMAVLAVAAFTICYMLVGAETGMAFAFFFLATALDQLNDTAWLTVRGTQRAWAEAPVSSISSIALAVICVAWLWAGSPSVLQIAVIALAVSTLRAAAAYRVARFPRRTTVSLTKAAQRLRDSWPYLGSDLLGLAYLRGDVFILAIFVTQTDLGHYISANSLVAPVVQLASMASLGALAFASRSGESDRDDNRKKVASLYYMLAVTSAIIMVPAIAAAVPIVFGQVGSDSIEFLATMLTAFLLLRVWNFSLSVRLVEMGQAKTRFYTLLASVCLNVGLNFAFAPKTGVLGAALATVLTEVAITFIFTARASSRRIALQSAALMGCAFCAVVITVVVNCVGWPAVAASASVAAVYCLGLIPAGVLILRDRRVSVGA